MRPVVSDSALSSSDCFTVVGATIELGELPVKSDHGSPLVTVLVHTLRGFVHGVEASGRLSQIANSVVQRILIDVVNQCRGLFTVVDKPSHSVGLISAPLVADVNATNRVNGTGRTSSLSSSGGIDLPSKLPSIRVVDKTFCKLVWDNFRSHFKLPLDLVRGVGTAIPAPPLYTSSTMMLATGVSNGIRT